MLFCHVSQADLNAALREVAQAGVCAGPAALMCIRERVVVCSCCYVGSHLIRVHQLALLACLRVLSVVDARMHLARDLYCFM